jgi:hypothetical protein
MRVLVVGSVREAQRADAIQAAAREIGKALGAQGHVVLVGTDDPIDIDPSVAAGVLEAGNAAARVEVHVPHGMAEPYAAKRPEALKVVRHQFPDWDVTNMEVLRRADAVVALAGRAGVVQAGVQGWTHGVPVIPVAEFGGGAKKLWDYGSSRRADFYRGALQDEEIDRLAAPWGTTLDAAFVVQMIERVAKAARLARTSPGMILGSLATLLAALVAWVLFLTFPYVFAPWLEGWSKALSLPLLFLSVSAAGFLGASMQTLRAIRAGGTVTPRVILLDTGLGVAAGVVVAMLYLLAQIAVAGEVKPIEEAKDYVRVTLIVSMASLFASLYLDAALARFDKIKGSVLTGKYSGKEAE